MPERPFSDIMLGVLPEDYNISIWNTLTLEPNMSCVDFSLDIRPATSGIIRRDTKVVLSYRVNPLQIMMIGAKGIWAFKTSLGGNSQLLSILSARRITAGCETCGATVTVPVCPYCGAFVPDVLRIIGDFLGTNLIIMLDNNHKDKNFYYEIAEGRVKWTLNARSA